MLDMDSDAHAASAGRSLWYSIFQALENERCLDLRFRATRTGLQDHDLVPNYKVMKQLALRNKLGILYRPFIAISLVIIPTLALFQWLLALFVSATRAPGESGVRLHIVPTTQVNITLIEAALLADPSLKEQLHDRDILTIGQLSGKVGLSGVIHCIASHILLLYHIFRSDRSRRTDLLLHSRDAFGLLLLVHFAQQHPNDIFATEDHYQRWAFLLSHYCKDFRIIQHGPLDMGIGFPHSFGVVRVVYIRDQIFSHEFAKYYPIQQITVFSTVRSFTKNSFSEVGIFLASSFPSIDDEIELIKLILAKRNIPIIVKFHPAHLYDSRKRVLVALASHVCFAHDVPACQLFVSHSSFMEFDYRASGIPTFSIARLGGPGETAQAIFALLETRQTQCRPADPIFIDPFSDPKNDK
jgi:hypothetical protein